MTPRYLLKRVSSIAYFAQALAESLCSLTITIRRAIHNAVMFVAAVARKIDMNIIAGEITNHTKEVSDWVHYARLREEIFQRYEKVLARLLDEHNDNTPEHEKYRENIVNGYRRSLANG